MAGGMAGPSRARPQWRFAESLEPRRLLSAATLPSVAVPSMHVVREAANSPASGASPAQIRSAYGFDQLQFSGVAADGRGATIAIVDAYDDPNIESDLNVFDQQFGIAAPPSFVKVYASQSAPRTDGGWSMEAALDVEWAHAMAPAASIVLVEARSDNLNDLLVAVNVARNLPAVNVVSMSWGVDEFAGETSYDGLFAAPAGHPGITFVAASGDQGGSTIWPSASANVLSVGGTSLSLAGGAYLGETAWSDGGGGRSRYEPEPTFQNAVQASGTRTTPDVAYDADPNTGLDVYDSVPSSRHLRGGWLVVGGTSAGVPQWAAIVALADQSRAADGHGSIGNAQSLMYQMPAADFHDIVSGSNGFSAAAGYDLATGLGSPAANLLVPDLAGHLTLGGVAAALTHSAEYFADFIKSAYATYLGRVPDAQGLAWWVSQMQAGVTDEQLDANLASSPEYVQLHGGADGAWVDAMYADLLQRSPDQAGHDFWIAELQLGLTRYEIALGIAASAEREAMVVRSDYFAYLGRTASAQDVALWVGQFEQGAHNEDIVAGFVGSAEYYNNAAKGKGSAASWLDSAYHDLFGRSPAPSETAFWLARLD